MTIQLNIDQTVPYPSNTEPEQAETLHGSMQLAANTAAVLEQLGAQIDDSPEAQKEADAVFADFAELMKREAEQVTQEKPKRGRPRNPDRAPVVLEKVPVAYRIREMLGEYNNQFVADAAELRLVTTNKLLDLASCGDPKVEIKATELLGKISDVGLFSDKSEITVTYNNTADLDAAIKDKIRKLMKLHAVDVPSTVIDVEKELGVNPDLPKVEDITPKAEPDA
jgi:hypothetical protein